MSRSFSAATRSRSACSASSLLVDVETRLMNARAFFVISGGTLGSGPGFLSFGETLEGRFGSRQHRPVFDIAPVQTGGFFEQLGPLGRVIFFEVGQRGIGLTPAWVQLVGLFKIAARFRWIGFELARLQPSPGAIA